MTFLRTVSACALGASLLFATSVPAGETLSWSESQIGLSPAMPAGIQMNGTAIVTVGEETFVYSVGGNLSTDGGGDTRSIHYAPVRGAWIGPWREATARLVNYGTTYHTRSTVGWNGRLIVVGGRLNQEGEGYAPFNGIRIFTPEPTGDLTLEKMDLYTGEGDGDTIPDAEPALDLLEMAAVINESNAHPGDGILYILAGGLGDDATDRVRSVRIDGATGQIVRAGPRGELAPALRELAPMPEDTAFHQAVLHEGRIYSAGNNPPSTAVHYAEILDDDSLGAWQTATAPLPEVRMDGGAASFGGNFYVLGGTTATNADVRNTVFRAVFGDDGDIVDWETDAPAPIEPGFRRVGATVGDEAIFIIGGRTADDGFSNRVLIATEAE